MAICAILVAGNMYELTSIDWFDQSTYLWFSVFDWWISSLLIMWYYKSILQIQSIYLWYFQLILWFSIYSVNVQLGHIVVFLCVTFYSRCMPIVTFKNFSNFKFQWSLFRPVKFQLISSFIHFCPKIKKYYQLLLCPEN